MKVMSDLPRSNGRIEYFKTKGWIVAVEYQLDSYERVTTEKSKVVPFDFVGMNLNFSL